MSDGGQHRAVILTAIPVEYKAVRDHLTNPQWDKRGRVPYQRGIFSTSNQVWDVLIRETGPGNVFAAVETLLAIHYFHPALVLFVGVAGGLKDVHIGDVVIPTKVYAYESGRANVTSFQTRPQVVNPTFPLVQLAQAEAKEQDWLQRLKEPLPDTLPNVLAAPIASGESVVASTRAAIYKFLRTSYSDAVAVEMESYGFLLAAHFYPEVDALVIRGISDRINNKKRTDSNDSQALAAHHASAFAFEVLAKVDIIDLQQKRHGAKTPGEPSIDVDHIGDDLHKSTAVTEDEPKMASATPISLQEFLQLIQQFKDEIREIHKLFGEQRTTFYDNCKTAIKLIENLDMIIKKYYYSKYYKRNVKFTVDKLNDQMRDLLTALSDFPHIHSSDRQRHNYAVLQKDIRLKFDLLIEKLSQLEELEQSAEES